MRIAERAHARREHGATLSIPRTASLRLFALTLGSPLPRGRIVRPVLIDRPTVAERSRPTSLRFNAVKSVAKRGDEARPDGSASLGFRVYTLHTPRAPLSPSQRGDSPVRRKQQYAARSSTPPSIAIRAISEINEMDRATDRNDGDWSRGSSVAIYRALASQLAQRACARVCGAAMFRTVRRQRRGFRVDFDSVPSI